MRIFYSAIALLALSASSMWAAAPVAEEYTGYTGTSFNANWSEADQARLSVFSLNPTSARTETQDFSSAIVNGKIDPDAAAALRPEWDIRTSGDGSDNVCFVNGKDMFTLNGNGSSVALVSHKGFLKTLKVKAHLVNAEGATEENASILSIQLLSNDGSDEGMMIGQASALAFALNTEYNFAEYFLAPGEVSQISGVRISIKKEGTTNVGDLAIESISFDYDERDYLLKDKSVSGGTHLVGNCDPAKAYFYYLTPADGDSQSKIIAADGFIAPSLLEPELVSPTSYTARWSTPYKAESITLRNYRVTEFTEPTDNYIVSENFDTAVNGTLETPEYTSDINQFCNLPGWTIAGGAGRTAAGMIGTAASPRPWPPMGGYMYSPQLDLSGCGGIYKLSFKLYGEPGDVITVYREGSMTPDNKLYGHQFTFDENGIIEQEYEMDDGAAGKSIRFESFNMKQFFIDYFLVSQKMPAGSIAYTLIIETDLQASETSFTFNNLEENGKYVYSVELHGYELNTRPRSVATDKSGLVDLSKYSAGVEAVENTGSPAVTVTTDGGLVTVRSAADCLVLLYRFDGTIIGNAGVSAGGLVSFPVTPGTPVIVKAGQTVIRIISK